MKVLIIYLKIYCSLQIMLAISSAAGSPHSRERRFVVVKKAGGVGTSGKKGANALPPLVLVGMVEQPVPTAVGVPSQAPQQKPYYPPQPAAYPAPQAASYYAPPQPAPYVPQMAPAYYAPSQPSPYAPQMASPYAPPQPSPYAPQMPSYMPQTGPYYAQPAYSAQQVGAGQPSAAAGVQQQGQQQQWQQSAGSDFAGSSLSHQQLQEQQVAAFNGNQQQLPLDTAVSNDVASVDNNNIA